LTCYLSTAWDFCTVWDFAWERATSCRLQPILRHGMFKHKWTCDYKITTIYKTH